jgi:AhpD family alkylhydroperoxidase
MELTPAAPRLGLKTLWPEGYRLMYQFNKAVHDSGLAPGLLELVKIRASQLNRCAFCINMHVGEARKLGEPEQRLALLPAFEEAPCYTPAEKAALALTEALTGLPAQGMPDALLARVRGHFDETQVAKLVFAVVLINAWNRIAVADQLPFAVEAQPTAPGSTP